jgi:hypothetical protein
MVDKQLDLARTSILAISLVAGIGLPAAAQETSPGLSSGSGQGTGSGRSTGVQRNTTGSMSGVGPPSSGLGRQVPVGPLPAGRLGSLGSGPGVNVQFPNDPYLVPFLRLEQFGGPVDPNAPTGVTPELLEKARLIESPEERSLALQRIARGAIASNQLTLGHQTLEEAASTVDSISDPLVHDQRLIALVTSLNALNRELVREALGEKPLRELDLVGQQAPQNHMDGALIIRMERLEWKRAVHLALNIINPTYRSEMLYRVVESMASGSKTIANGFARGSDGQVSIGNTPEATPSDDQRTEKFRKLADEILVDSFEVAKQIDRLVWKFQGEVQIALQAANSQQFTRGVELATQIDNAKSRAEALLLLADPMCRRERAVNLRLEKPLPKDDRGYVTFRFPPQFNSRIEFQGEWDPDPRKSGDPRKLVLKGYISQAEFAQLAALLDDRVYQRALAELSRLYNADQDTATPVYQKAAEATASIETDGLRGVIVGLLVDGLSGSGRFEDARTCTALYPLESERFVALGAIAEAQGRRGAADSARRWIAEEAPEQYRAALYRRVADGELWVIEENRGRQTLKGLEEMPRVP